MDDFRRSGAVVLSGIPPAEKLDLRNMSKKKLRAIVAGGGIALSAGTGAATNFLTEQLSWALGAVVVVLVIAGVALAVANSMLEHRIGEPAAARPDHRSDEPPTAPKPSSPRPSGVSQDSIGDRTTQVGRDYYRNGMPAGYVVLSLVVVAAAAVAVLLVALRFAPSSAPNPTLVNTPIVTTPPATTAAPALEDLRYEVTATRNRAREVKVKATAYGQPEPGLKYWFFVEVDYGNNYVEYYPRRKLTGRTTSFDIQLSADADLKYSRTGRIYGLTSAQNTEASVRLQRQETTKKDDYFDKAPGQPASDKVKMPF